MPCSPESVVGAHSDDLVAPSSTPSSAKLALAPPLSSAQQIEPTLRWQHQVTVRIASTFQSKARDGCTGRASRLHPKHADSAEWRIAASLTTPDNQFGCC